MSDMHSVHLGAIDLNLLRVLDALLATRSVTTAARKLGLSQSATSHALARLRTALGDALFVRGKTGWMPTARASALAEPLRDALARLEAVVTPPRPFDAGTATRSFTVATADYFGLVMLPDLVGRLAASAPGIDLWMRAQDRSVGRMLGEGEADVFIGPRRVEDEGPGILERRLFDERYVCIVRRGHPALGKRWTAQRFARLRHALIAPRARPGGAVDTALAERGLSRRVALGVSSFLAAPFAVASSDLVLTMPERVARRFAELLPLEVVAPPIELPGFTMAMLWHERVHREPGHVWLREQIVALARGLDR